MDYIFSFVAMIIAILSLFMSYRADKRTKWLEQEKEREKHIERKASLILESERKNALIGKLLLILVKKIELLEENPNLQKNSQKEVKRLEHQIRLFQSFQSNSEKRASLEHPSIGANIDIYNLSYTKIKQLIICIEKEIEIEKYDYEELRAKNKKQPNPTN